MDRTRDRRGGRRGHARALRAVLTSVKVGVLAVLLVGPTAGAVQSPAPAAGGASAGCVRTSSDADRPALIRTGQGQIRQVSFDVAWDVYNGRRPGTVLAVCLDGSRRR